MDSKEKEKVKQVVDLAVLKGGRLQNIVINKIRNSINEADNDSEKVDFLKSSLEMLRVSNEDVDVGDFQVVSNKDQRRKCNVCETKTSNKLKCKHYICIECIVSIVDVGIEEKKCNNLGCPVCDLQFEAFEIQNALLDEENKYLKYLDICFQEFISNNDGDLNLIKCANPECDNMMDWIIPTENERKKAERDKINEKDDDGVLLTRTAYVHFSLYRLRCRGCQNDFCTQCNTQPYHKGFTCEQFENYKNANKCRYCGNSIKNNNNNNNNNKKRSNWFCCDDEDCLEKNKMACPNQHACGHFCIGHKGELDDIDCIDQECIDLIEDENDKPSQTNDDFCNICWIDSLASEPCIELNCGHIMHYNCLREQIESKWSGSRITFSFLECILCKSPIDQPSESLDDILDPLYELKEKVESMALERLKLENMEKDEPLTDPNSPYYNKKLNYAMDSFAFYNCFKCKEPFFGGHRDCEANAADESKPEDFICMDCSDVNLIVRCNDPSHAEYQIWKCRYCCNEAMWFCFGTTHFCDPCHNMAGTIPNQSHKWPTCEGGPNCNLKLSSHPKAGEEFAMGCAVCKEEAETSPEMKEKIKRQNERIMRQLKNQKRFLLLLKFVLPILAIIYSISCFSLNSLYEYFGLFLTALRFVPMILSGLITSNYVNKPYYSRSTQHLLLVWAAIIGTLLIEIYIYLRTDLLHVFTIFYYLLIVSLVVGRIISLGFSIFFFVLGIAEKGKTDSCSIFFFSFIVFVILTTISWFFGLTSMWVIFNFLLNVIRFGCGAFLCFVYYLFNYHHHFGQPLNQRNRKDFKIVALVIIPIILVVTEFISFILRLEGTFNFPFVPIVFILTHLLPLIRLVNLIALGIFLYAPIPYQTKIKYKVVILCCVVLVVTEYYLIVNQITYLDMCKLFLGFFSDFLKSRSSSNVIINSVFSPLLLKSSF